MHTNLLEDIIESTDNDSDSTKQLLQKAIKGIYIVNKITYSEVLKTTQQKLHQKLSTFTSNHNAKLWIQYLYLNDLL